MRRIAEIEEMKAEVIRATKEAKAANNKDLVSYYEGVINALGWIRDKAGEETMVIYPNA